MAVVAPVVERFGGSSMRITWPNLKAGDIGEAVTPQLFQDRSAQVKGTFSTGKLAIEGSNDGEEFVSLTDPRGNDLVIMAAKIEQIEDCSFSIRPTVQGGDAFTDLTVILFARKGD